MKVIRASAPANIALIKYMGKSDINSNLPINSSLSYTLEHLRSTVELVPTSEGRDVWEPLVGPGFLPMNLSEKGQRRFLEHFIFLKKQMGLSKNHFLVRSANDFPADCGVASSASAFAALTRASCLLIDEKLTASEQAEWSRQGSGSSCRSFFNPWCLWPKEQPAQSVDLPLRLKHLLVVVNADAKKVSSSEAHQRVGTSLLYQGRIERAEGRLESCLSAFRRNDWPMAFEIVWSEFWDMHSLFETSSPPFGYMNAGSIEVLNYVRKFWHERGDGPLATMDAGANVHLLFRHDQSEISFLMSDFLRQKFILIDDQRGQTSESI